MTDRLKPNTKAWQDRQRRHRHNGFKGSARMMEVQLYAILGSDSTTADTKHIAAKMLLHIEELKESLQNRVDP